MGIISKLSRDIPAESFDPTTKRGFARGVASVFITAYFFLGIYFFAALTSTIGSFPDDLAPAMGAGIVAFIVGIVRVARLVYVGPGWMKSARWRLLNTYGALALFWVLLAIAPAIGVLAAIGILLGNLVAYVGAFLAG